jgi:hypothetical protein
MINTDSFETSSGEKDNKNMLYSTEFINQLEFIGVHSRAIVLKIGIPIMLL